MGPVIQHRQHHKELKALVVLQTNGEIDML